MIGFVLVPVIIIGLVLNGLRLRARVPQALPAAAGTADAGDWVCICARGVAADELTLRDGAAYAQAADLDMIDLVPAELPVTAARDLLRRVRARSYRADRLAVGRSAGAAILAAATLLKRAEVSSPGVAAAAGAGAEADAPEAADLIELARRVKPYAERGAAIVVAPRLRPGADDLARRKARLRASDAMVPIHIGLDVIPYLLIVVALVTAWPWGLAAALAYCLQPYLVFGGTPLRPRGLHTSAALRLVHDPYVWVRTIAGRWRSETDHERDAEIAAASAYYGEALASGTAGFFEERRGDCPWCGSRELSVRLSSGDYVMGKPGTFVLEKCGGCGHIFQNPRLTPAGLDFYYRDVYDGLGSRTAESIFLTGMDAYHKRARMLIPFTTPRTWLDVGTGHAHFCAVARETWPDTVFDGLDQGAVVEDAQRRGWIATAHRGAFPELAGDIAGRYDVVSMHHYLEHTRDPLAELDAAALMLSAGAYLLIELPDPEWPLARVFGRYWMSWFQPQHQHMMPIGNLISALERRGLRPVAVERAPAHQPNDALMAVWLCSNSVAADPALPWVPPPTAASRIRRAVVGLTSLPLIVTGLVFDRTVGQALARHWERGSAYRVLARKEGTPRAD